MPVLMHCLYVCARVAGENVRGRTPGPRNSMCAVNALFKTINIPLWFMHNKGVVKCLVWCVRSCTRMTGALMRRGEHAWASAWAAGPPSDRLLGSRCAEVLSGCRRGLPEETHTPNSLSELTASFSSLHFGFDRHSLDASLQLCAMLWCTHTHRRTHSSVYMCNPTQRPPFLIRLPLVFDVVFGEPCLKKFFSSFEVGLCVSHSLSALFPLLSSDSVRVGRETGQCGTRYLPHILYLPCVVPANLRSFSNRSYCFPREMQV